MSTITYNLTTWLLWLLVVIGAWNAINIPLRIYYREKWWAYWFSVAVGMWAQLILWLR